jgi:hypothetical protein
MKSSLVLGLLTSLGFFAGLTPAAVSETPKIAWGKEDGQMQLGVRLMGEPHPYKVGESLDLEVHLRYNAKTGADALIPADLSPGSGNVPSVVNEKGEHLIVHTVIYLGAIPLLPHKLVPGKSERLGKLRVLLTAPGNDKPEGQELRLGVTPGKYRLSQHESVRVGLKDSRTFGLESGQVEFQVAAAGKK